MGNNPSLYTATSPEEYVDDNVWFTINISEYSNCSDQQYSGYLRFPYEDPRSSSIGVAVFDPNDAQTINGVAKTQKDVWKSGYCWKLSKDGKYLISRRPGGDVGQFQRVDWAWSIANPVIRFGGLPTGGSIFDLPIDRQRTNTTRQLWFGDDRKDGGQRHTLSGLKAANWTSDPRSVYSNENYPKARLCWENPAVNYKITFNLIDLGSDTFIGEEVGFEVFMTPEGYRDWFAKRLMTKFWTSPGKKAPEPYESLIQSWLRSLPPAIRSQQLFSSSRCSYADGNSYWADEICRYGCNGDGSKNNPSLQYCPQIGNVITKPPYPNDYLRSEIGRAYCKQNPGKCEGALTSWCVSVAPDADGKFSKDPFGKAAMCACSWGLDIRKKKILEQIPSIRQMMDSKDVFTRQVGERVLQSQLAFFTCKDPQCIESSVYKNMEDKTRPCPSDMIQNCITNITVDAGGNITVAKDIASNTQCTQTLQQILGSKEYECIKAGGKIVTDSAGNSVCCKNGVSDGKCLPDSCPAGQIRVGDKCVTPDPSCKGEIVKGQCVEKCPTGYTRLPDGTCGTQCAGEYYRGQCVEKCKPGFARDSTGHCVASQCAEERELINGKCEPKCPAGQIRDYTGKCIFVNPPVPKPDPSQPSFNPVVLYTAAAIGVALILVVALRN